MAVGTPGFITSINDMNKAIIIAIVLLGTLGGLGIAAMLYVAHQVSPSPVPYGGKNPVYDQTQSTTTTQTPGTQTTPLSDSALLVKQAFAAAIPVNDPEHTRLGETVVAGAYALQVWDGDHAGGEALLKYNAKTSAWQILAPGGGLWGVAALMKFGMDRDTALTLLNGVRNLK
jgi:hypothetical protein